MEHVTLNFTVRSQRMHERGRDYLVAPVVMISPGVLQGSSGALHYSRELLENAPEAWNNVPILVEHPGHGRLAADVPEQAVGHLRRCQTDEADGRLKGEAWVDETAIRKLAPDVHSKMLKGQAVEVSSGLLHDTDGVPGTCKGVQYEASVTSMTPDHLAILRTQRGACGVTDGCGLGVNASTVRWNDIVYFAKKAERDRTMNANRNDLEVLAIPTIDWVELSRSRQSKSAEQQQERPQPPGYDEEILDPFGRNDLF